MQQYIDTSSQTPLPENTDFRLGYLFVISFVAALGGLLFGYDWVVIGGARAFLESYFNLQSPAMVGWINSCALVGCFIGSLSAGRISDRYGRKSILLLTAFLFAISSVFTGWAQSFHTFVLWRIIGGVAIGIASSVSPMYIAEISPAKLRGRLVSLNQFAIVIGILASQIANWRIARPISPETSAAMLSASWNVQFAWRWMFTAVAVPAVLFLILAPFLPESPRWLMSKGREDKADAVLLRIGGSDYSLRERSVIRQFKQTAAASAPWRSVFACDVRKMLLIGIGLVILQQGSGINILFNYAEEVYRTAGFSVNDVLFNIVITGIINLVFTLVAIVIVDHFGRRRIMILGSIAIGISHLCGSLAYTYHWGGMSVLVLSLCAIACYAMSLAPMTWVLLSEIFPVRVRAQSMALSVATLWIASFGLTVTFPYLNRNLGMAGTFLIYAAICFGGAIMVYIGVPETTGRSLEEISN